MYRGPLGAESYDDLEYEGCRRGCPIDDDGGDGPDEYCGREGPDGGCLDEDREDSLCRGGGAYLSPLESWYPDISTKGLFSSVYLCFLSKMSGSHCLQLSIPTQEIKQSGMFFI